MASGTNVKKWTITPVRLLLYCVFLLLLMMFFVSVRPQDVSKESDYALTLEDQDVLLYLEAITRIKETASFLDSSTTREKIIHDTLRSYLTQKDAFSDYLTREEYRKFKEIQNDRYIGVGMEIEKDHNGNVICVPYPGSPAEKAGIVVGDRIKSIDGVSVYGKSLFAIASMAIGKRGTEVNFVILTQSSIEKRVRAIRSDVATEPVSKYWFEKRPVIKISSFTKSTKEQLKRVLSTWGTENPIVLDLRNNAGGDFNAAIDSAMLFLEKGRTIVSIQTRRGPTVYESSGGAVNITFPIYLWQDEKTASAAEVFISALTENNRAISIGTRTFGKGTRQEIIELSDGSALILTTGDLQTPSGTAYQGHGLSPMHPLKDVPAKTTQYITKMEEVISLKGETVPTGILK